ncbi:MAG: electron transport complex subunit RsxC [Proteobacteria bacterium]|nr:MAG: electron transport complex subunit RsxC [Pseudomonadota bacterium]
MRQLHDFPGGIHPPENKAQSTGKPIRQAQIPSVLIVPVSQHSGKPAKPIVDIGQTVLKGQKIAEAAASVSVPVHAPTSGTISAITDHLTGHPSGMAGLCIVIEPDGEDTWIELAAERDYRSMTPEQIREIIRDKGIVGMGGAGFPTEIKLHSAARTKIQTLIINAAECEPCITADDMLLREQASRVLAGMEIMAFLSDPAECVIGIEDNKPEAIAALREAAKGSQIEIAVIPTKYPSGGEKQLIKILTGLEVPSGKLPADIGVLCQNAGTAAAVYDAVVLDKPLVSRVVTVTGRGVSEARNYQTMIGTRIGDLLDEAGYREPETRRVIIGGPMMGVTVNDMAIPVTKTTNCIIAASAQELPQATREQACIRCGYCVEACPMGLLPQQLFLFSKNRELEKAELFNLQDCIECGACSYVCPSQIPLVQYYRFAKGEIRQQKMEKAKSDRARLRFEFRKERMAREAAEKEAKRKARAEAAAKAQAAKRKAQANQNNEGNTAPSPSMVKSAIQGGTNNHSPSAARATPRIKKPTLEQRETNPDNHLHQPPNQEAIIAEQNLKKMKSSLTKAETKLGKMVAAAEQIKPDDIAAKEKIQRAIDKNKARVEAARVALNEAQEAARKVGVNPD